MTDMQTITYLWSAIILMGGFLLMVYFWLKPILDAKLNYMFKGGQGTLDIATDGTIALKVQNTDRDDCVNIRDRKKPINPNFKQLKFLGIPCQLFVPVVPTNVDLKFNKKSMSKEEELEILQFNEKYKTNLDVFEGRINYEGIQDRDVDTHVANMTKDPLREIWLKYKTNLLYIMMGILLGIAVLGFFMYKNHEALKVCGTTIGTTIENVVMPK